MTKEDWKKTLEDQIKFDHEYIPSFQTTIQILSEMLEERDRVYSMYIESGAQPVVNFTSDRGATNLKQNPLLKQWQELNVTALSYLRDLGLTAQGLRKLQGQLPKESQSTGKLEDIRRKVGLTTKEVEQLTNDGLRSQSQTEQIMTMIRAKSASKNTVKTKKGKKTNEND